MVHVFKPAELAGTFAHKLYSSALTVALRSELRNTTAVRPAPGQQIDVLLNFPDGPINLYQVRQWYGPLEHLAKIHSVAILCYHPKTAELIADETNLRVVLTPSFSDLSEVKQILRPKVILYPNQNYVNYGILGLTTAEHIFICHGESDKIYMASNWVKIFNYFFVAGQASKDRLSRHVRNYDVDARTIEIGRPQIDSHLSPPVSKTASKITVLYAPTWEGGRQSMRYSSVVSHGLSMVRALLSDSRFQVIYRPHPRTGIQLREYDHANVAIKQLIQNANARKPDPLHIVDTSTFDWQLEFADIMITDVSAVAYDWLTTAKPLIATKPLEPLAVMPDEGFMSDAPLVASSEASGIVPVIESLLTDPDAQRRLSSWANYYYGNRSPGSSLKRFVLAIDRVIAERDEKLEARATSPRPDANLGCSATHSGRTTRPTNPEPSIGGSVLTLGRYLRASTTKLADFMAREAGQKANFNISTSAMTRRKADIVVSTMAGPHNTGNLLSWVDIFETIDRSASVAIITGNYRTYKKLKSVTGLRVLLGNSATATEQLFEELSPKFHLQFEQDNLNLRETTYRNVHHVYVGSSKNDSWINNRLRLFDTVIVPDACSCMRIAKSLIDFPPTISVIVANRDDPVDRHQALAGLIRDIDTQRSPMRARRK